LSSRLGNPAPQPRTGAARFASPSNVKALESNDVLASTDQSEEEPKRKKQPMTIRLTLKGIDHLAELERSLRRAGVKARQASASEIVEALVQAATPESVHKLIHEIK
jgi:hypothetical protein